MNGSQAIEEGFGKGSYLQWLDVRDNASNFDGHVGVIKQGDNILRTLTGVVTAKQRHELDVQIMEGTIALVPHGEIIEPVVRIEVSQPTESMGAR